jgi:hypothetical protein
VSRETRSQKQHTIEQEPIQRNIGTFAASVSSAARI